MEFSDVTTGLAVGLAAQAFQVLDTKYKLKPGSCPALCIGACVLYNLCNFVNSLPSTVMGKKLQKDKSKFEDDTHKTLYCIAPAMVQTTLAALMYSQDLLKIITKLRNLNK